MDQVPVFDDEAVAESSTSMRRAPRDSMFLSAELICKDRPPQPLRVRNISASGLMAEGVCDCAIGDPITIALRNIGPVEGHVVWVDGSRAGITFDVAIDPRRTRKPVGAGRALPPSAAPVRRSSLRTE